MPTPEETYAALAALRDAATAGAVGSDADWRVVRAKLEALAQANLGTTPEVREELVQLASIKVLRGVGRIRADSAPSAVAWLRTILEHLWVEHHRRLARARSHRSLDVPAGEEARPLHETLEAAAPDPIASADPEALREHEEALWDFVGSHLDASSVRRSAIASAFRNAQLAYAAVIGGRSTEELRALLGGEVKDNTVQKRAGRGRTDVLVPAVEAWIPTLPEDEPRRAYAEQLLALLLDKARADAGKPRPDRRTASDGSLPVSPTDDCASEQYEDEGQHD